jgi:hypothetical protein
MATIDEIMRKYREILKFKNPEEKELRYRGE